MPSPKLQGALGMSAARLGRSCAARIGASMKLLLLIYTLGTLTDYWTTAWALARGATEKNPFMASMIAKHGVEATLYFKIGAIIFMCLTVWVLKKSDKKLTELWGAPCRGGHWLAFGTIWASALLQWGVVANNFWQMRIAMAMGL